MYRSLSAHVMFAGTDRLHTESQQALGPAPPPAPSFMRPPVEVIQPQAH